ncbi:WRKY DNA-binding transcription factor 70-like [Pistacia vera]|uniref:WRKY DNA-binding transcription factor 70-like n=1 Tax=Pistacia vera TaxID=55513 RepID=UPI001262BE50|nr:WRKY DNA-binding transcription factor 70-like [Pistacia vera]
MAALCSYRNKLIQELLQGQKFANELRLLLHDEHKPFQQQQQHGLVSSHQQELAVKILRSFTESLSALSSGTTSELLVSDDRDYHQLQLLPPTNSSNGSPCTDDRRLEDSGESQKRPAFSNKDRRGCYKRKKNLDTWRMVSSTVEDAHAWRKYGQKEILNAKHPRSYYRCTHKYDQGCRATKQVQRMEDNPEMFEITYIGNHTCKDLFTAPKIITDSDHPWGTTGSHIVRSLNSYTPTKIKQECKEETTQSDDISENLSSLDSVVWDDLVPFESSDPAAAAVSTVYSCNKMPSNSFDIDLDREFHFDESEFLLN